MAFVCAFFAGKDGFLFCLGLEVVVAATSTPVAAIFFPLFPLGSVVEVEAEVSFLKVLLWFELQAFIHLQNSRN